MLGGMGAGALGIASAALLGCTTQSPVVGGNPAAIPAPNIDAGLAGMLIANPVVQGKPRQGGVFNVPVTAVFINNDVGTSVSTSIWHCISSKALEWDSKTGKLVPHVVQSWEVKDPLNIVLKLNPNVSLHNKPPWNGRQFTAEDLAWNLERNAGFYAERLKITPSLFARSTFYANMTKAEAIDPLTVRVKFSAPNSGFFNAGLAHSRGGVVMPKEMDDIGFGDPLKMAGTGPFEVTEWLKDQRSTYKKAGSYAKFRPNEPYFDVHNQLSIPDLASQQSAFLTDQIQVYAPGFRDIPLIKKAKPDALLYQWTGNSIPFVRPGFKKYLPFRDFRVRKAIHLSIDYAEIAENVYGPGWVYQASTNPAIPQAWRPEKVKTLPGWNPNTKAQDRAEAAKLLAAAGYPNGKGLDFRLTYYNPSGVTEYALRFQGQLTSLYSDMKVGFDSSPDNATQGKKTNTADFDALVYGHDQTQDAMFHAFSETRTGGNRNEGQFSDPGADVLLDKMLVELNTDRFNEMFEEFQQRWVTEWHPNWIMPAGITNTFVQSSIGGYDTTAGALFTADYSTQMKVGRWFYVDK